jgi:spore coat protein U-like protein
LTKTMKLNVIVLACILVLAAGSAFAQGTATSNMSVTATVSSNCTIAANALAFGVYDPIVANAAAPLNGSTTINVTCTNGSPTNVTLDQGLNPAGGSTNAAPLRQMASGGNFLSYFLYQDAGFTTVWGNTAGTGVNSTGTGVSVAINLFGQIPAGQNVPAGSYADTVVATITF